MSNLTKRTLAKSLKDMLSQKSLDKITVTDLVKKCQLNRQTFYYHFRDIYDLLSWIYKTEAIGAISNSRSHKTWKQGLMMILSYVEDNHDLCINTYRSLGKGHLEMFLNDVIFELLEDVLDEIDQTHLLKEEEQHFILRFYCHAFTGTLLDWIKEGMKTPKEIIARYIEQIMENQFSLVLNRFK